MPRKAAIAAFSVLAVMAATFLFLRELQARYVMLYTYTDDAGGLTEGTSVRLNGIGIGYIDKLTLTNSRDPKRRIEFTMKVRRSKLPDIPRDSLVSVAATNLLGNYFVDIIRGRSRQAVEPGGELASTASVDPNRLLAEMGNELQQIQAIFDRFGKLVTEVGEGLGNIGMWENQGLGQVDQLSEELKKLTTDIQNGHGNLSKLDDVKAQMDGAQARLNDLTAAYQAGQGSAGKLQALSTEFQQLSTEANQLTAQLNSDQAPGKKLNKIQAQIDELQQRLQGTFDRINSGQGTLGQFEVNPQLSESLAVASSEFQTLAKDIRANPRKFLHFHVQLF
jgi:phospholipid/cholesterol/gamma-HCH transport system substrate-binding protein